MNAPMAKIGVKQLIDASHIATRQSRGAPILNNTLNNLPRVRESMSATRSRPLAGMPAIIVGAGPSLTQQLPLLDYAGTKAAIIAVNTALPALKRADLLVTMEQIPLVDHVDTSKVDALAVDLMASPEMWEHCARAKKPMYWCTCPNTPISDTCLLGFKSPQLWYHYAATMGAVALAMEWGADPVILLGCDLAYDVDGGRSYAESSAWGSETAAVKMDPTHKIMMMKVAVDPERVARAKKLGVKPPMEYQPCTELPAWGDTEESVWTVSDLACQWSELSTNLASRAKSLGIRAINATAGGAHIPGWEDMYLGDVLPTLPDKEEIEWTGHRINELEYQSGLAYVGELEERCRPVATAAALQWEQDQRPEDKMPAIVVNK